VTPWATTAVGVASENFRLFVELIVPHEIAKFSAVDLIEGGRYWVGRTGASIAFCQGGIGTAGEDKLLAVPVGGRVAAKRARSICILILVAGRKVWALNL
jgi:hypothetical protein